MAGLVVSLAPHLRQGLRQEAEGELCCETTPRNPSACPMLDAAATQTKCGTFVNATHITTPLPLPWLTCLTALAACHVPADDEVSAAVVLAQDHVLDSLTWTWGEQKHTGFLMEVER